MYMNSYMNSYKLWIHMIFSYMNSYVSWIHIWIRVYQGSRWPSSTCWAATESLCAAPLRGIAPITTLERFVVYCLCKQIISALPQGAAQRALGIAQAVTPCQSLWQVGLSWCPCQLASDFDIRAITPNPKASSLSKMKLRSLQWVNGWLWKTRLQKLVLASTA